MQAKKFEKAKALPDPLQDILKRLASSGGRSSQAEETEQEEEEAGEEVNEAEEEGTDDEESNSADEEDEPAQSAIDSLLRKPRSKAKAAAKAVAPSPATKSPASGQAAVARSSPAAAQPKVGNKKRGRPPSGRSLIDTSRRGEKAVESLASAVDLLVEDAKCNIAFKETHDLGKPAEAKEYNKIVNDKIKWLTAFERKHADLEGKLRKAMEVNGGDPTVRTCEEKVAVLGDMYKSAIAVSRIMQGERGPSLHTTMRQNIETLESAAVEVGATCLCQLFKLEFHHYVQFSKYADLAGLVKEGSPLLENMEEAGVRDVGQLCAGMLEAQFTSMLRLITDSDVARPL